MWWLRGYVFIKYGFKSRGYAHVCVVLKQAHKKLAGIFNYAYALT